MNKLYIFVLSTLCATELFGQVKIEALQLNTAQYQFVDRQSRLPVNEFRWTEVESFVNGFAKVAVQNTWNLVNQQGNPISKNGFDGVRNMVNRRAAVLQGNKWGFIDEKGNQVVPYGFDIVFDFKEAVTGAFRNNSWFLINRQGVTIKQLDIDIFYGFNNGTARVSRKGIIGSMNTSGAITFANHKVSAIPKKLKPLSSSNADCPENINFEFGNFTNWKTDTGSVAAVGRRNVISVDPSPATPNRHEIYAKSTPSVLDPYGLFPINPPDGSGYALKLGNNINGSEAERASYQFTVPVNAVDASITYRYAVVFQDPGHEVFEQPRFIAKLLDVAANTYLPCASFEYVSDNALPGFFSSVVDDTVKCRTWSSVFINLSAYAGKTLRLEFTTADCTIGAHWGYAYVDVGECNVTADLNYQCSLNQVTLNGPPGFQQYNWWNSDYTAIVATGSNTSVRPAPPTHTILHVEVIPYPGFGCTDTLDVEAINLDPHADAGPDKTICKNAAVKIGTPAIAGNTYTWSPSTYLSDPNAAEPTSTPLVSTLYIVTVHNATNGCTNFDTVLVNVPTTTAMFDVDPSQCLQGNKFTFTNNSVGALSNYWSFGDSSFSTIPNPTHIYGTAKNYLAKLVVTGSNGCMDSITHPVTVYANPSITAHKDSSMCRGNVIQLNASGGATYEWTPAVDLSCNNCANPLANPTNNATYFVKGTNAEGCPAFDTVNITVFQPIQVSVSPDAAICDLQKINLLASGAFSYKWTPAASLSNSTIPNPDANPRTTTTYRVVGYDNHQCFTDTGFVTITVNPTPTVELGADLNLPTGTSYQFKPDATKEFIRSWLWTPADNLSCKDCENPTLTVKNSQQYTLKITNTYGCFAIDSIHIIAFCEGSQVYIPNAFTPDGDKVNDIFMIRAKGIESVRSFRIYSRWGELIFEKKNFLPNNPEFGWDGKIRGVVGPAEVYVYTAEVICDNHQTYFYKGNVSILK